MTLQDWGAIGELVGGVAIIVSLLYVALQIRHSTRATQAATMQAFSAQYSDIMNQIATPGVSEVFWKGIEDLEELKGREIVAFMALMGSIARTYETFYFEAQEGRFESKMYDGWLSQMTDLFCRPGVRQYWELRRHQFSPEFGELVETMVAQSKPRKIFPGDPADN